ncbi:hypothetical protein BIW11_08923 [Tropilaelaps mercedesae]|uniref:Uncharacterized protein n=1 Tax=Tropilaelaps mercedesae TaxID=418985 RepID=A0A1V9XMP5_9ACAR|nr:hypothetical protein BIW11_08923 [Tropilaelaps mercedesae]
MLTPFTAKPTTEHMRLFILLHEMSILHPTSIAYNTSAM